MITLPELAKHLGVSKSTVSVALRGRRGVSESLRRKIQEEAERLGYRPDPIAGELMAMVRSNRQPADGDVIAFVNVFREPEWLHRLPTLEGFLRGAEEEAIRAGYRVEEFQAWSDGMTPARLAGILRARGIRGVILGPRWKDEPEPEFHWGEFSCFLVGEARSGPGVHRVCNHHVHSCALAIHELAARGYRRIGVKLQEHNESVRGYDYLVGVDEARRALGRKVSLFTLLAREAEAKRVQQWIRKERLDALVSLDTQSAELAASMEAPDGSPLGYANLNVDPDSGWSGIDQCPEEIGATAAELLRLLLQNGERGTRTRPRIVLIEGSWVDGNTTRPLPSTEQ